MSWQTIVELSCGEQDWFEVRESFVRAFHHYPLYKYLIPDDQKRPEFLRNYLEAIYEVTVRNGDSILVAVKQRNCSGETRIIGGVLFVRPSQTSGGWQCAKDQEFWDAYEKYNVKSIDEDAFERLERYEEWEYERISKHVCAGDIPMWNGVYCAIDPTYAGQGCGSISYSECIRLMSAPPSTKVTSKTSSERRVKTKVQSFFKKCNRFLTNKEVIGNDKHRHSPPTLFVLSHSRSAVRFHQKNGLQLVSSIPYESDRSNPAFDVSILVLSPLRFSRDRPMENTFLNSNVIRDNTEQRYCAAVA